MFTSTRLRKISCLPLVCLCFWPLFAAADFDVKVSEEERAVFSFFKLAHADPDYPAWVRESEIYKNAKSPEKREEIYEQEKLRLKWGFGTHDVEENPLKISTDILLQLKTTKDGPTLNFKFLHSANSEIPFFPYPYGKELIALIIEDLQNFVTVPLGPKQYAAISAYLQPQSIYKGKIALRIMPKVADHAQAHDSKEGKLWLMLGNVAYLEFLYNDPQSGEQKTLWSYTAPWYLNASENTLLDLLGQ